MTFARIDQSPVAAGGGRSIALGWPAAMDRFGVVIFPCGELPVAERIGYDRLHFVAGTLPCCHWRLA
jgi:hypothetical protein